jgi:DNA repair protein RecO (recombination protein O)
MFVFHLRLLGLAGFAPQVAACTACGCPVDAEKSWELKPERGGLACADCGGGGFQVRAGSLKLMGLIQTLPLDKLDRVRVSDQAMAEAGPFLMALTRHTLGRELKSSRFLEQIGRRPPSA